VQGVVILNHRFGDAKRLEQCLRERKVRFSMLEEPHTRPSPSNLLTDAPWLMMPFPLPDALEAWLRRQRTLESQARWFGLMASWDFPTYQQTRTLRLHELLPWPFNAEAWSSFFDLACPAVLDKERRPHPLLTSSLIGQTSAMSRVHDLIERSAPSNASVLISGESGTGKELAAKALHHLSGRSPFISINCAAIPEALLESELFGHQRGAFTGALANHPGKIRQAEGGTLFLDEIGAMPLSLQVKLLRVLQERSVTPIGGTHTIPVDIRIIAATNAELPTMVKSGVFRQDLFYRLNVIPLILPPLRDRKEDIPLLVNHFLQKSIDPHNPLRFSREAMDLLCQHHWPGNVRELENVVARSLVLCAEQGIVTPSDLPLSLHLGDSSRPAHLSLAEDDWHLEPMLKDVERTMIDLALKRSRGVKAKAARLLGLKRTTLIERMKKLGMMP
jgi:transcriptional regulator with PAS, ATPase and Fis domain